MNTRLMVTAVSVALGLAGSVFATSASACGIPDFSHGLPAVGLQASAQAALSRSVTFVGAPLQDVGRSTLRLVPQASGNGNSGLQGHGAIAGMWLFIFTADGNPADVPQIPFGVQVDTGFQTWHDDGTELTNSGGRAPVTSAFCQGVWKQKGDSGYSLNHWAISWDANSNFVGPANIREEVTVDGSGNSFSGTFSIDQYVSPPPPAGSQPDLTDLSIHVAHITGTVSATRITP